MAGAVAMMAGDHCGRPSSRVRCAGLRPPFEPAPGGAIRVVTLARKATTLRIAVSTQREWQPRWQPLWQPRAKFFFLATEVWVPVATSVATYVAHSSRVITSRACDGTAGSQRLPGQEVPSAPDGGGAATGSRVQHVRQQPTRSRIPDRGAAAGDGSHPPFSRLSPKSSPKSSPPRQPWQHMLGDVHQQRGCRPASPASTQVEGIANG
jgi:hypothetical protein